MISIGSGSCCDRYRRRRTTEISYSQTLVHLGLQDVWELKQSRSELQTLEVECIGRIHDVTFKHE
jgi:hypothetical protein